MLSNQREMHEFSPALGASGGRHEPDHAWEVWISELSQIEAKSTAAVNVAEAMGASERRRGADGFPLSQNRFPEG